MSLLLLQPVLVSAGPSYTISLSRQQQLETGVGVVSGVGNSINVTSVPRGKWQGPEQPNTTLGVGPALSVWVLVVEIGLIINDNRGYCSSSFIRCRG